MTDHPDKHPMEDAIRESTIRGMKMAFADAGGVYAQAIVDEILAVLPRESVNAEHFKGVLGQIEEERQRQASRGYDASHDDQHSKREIAEVAEELIHFVLNPHHCRAISGSNDPRDPSRWHLHIIHKWKHDPKRMLIIAAALLVAEIERITRAEAAMKEKA